MTNQLTFKCPKCDERVPAEDGLLIEHGHVYTGSCNGSGTRAAREVTLVEDIGRVAARLCLGQPVLGERFSAGPYTPAVEDGFPYAVLSLQGAPVILAHDAYDTAVWLCQLESGAVDAPEGAPICLVSNEMACEFARRDSERDSIEGYYSYYAAHLDRKRAANQGARP